MEYQLEVIISCPIEKVHEKFIDLESRTKWQKGLISQELISGNGFENGTQTELVFDMGKRQMTMIETILENELPNRLKTSYETDGVFNTSDDQFEALDERTTRYVSVQDFQMNSFTMKFMSIFMSAMFKKQTLDTMTAFKQFCETE